jgi:Ca2+-transporting ATPase
MEMIIDPVCSIAFESEPDEKGIMNRMPRKPGESFFGSKRILLSVFAGCLLLGEVLFVYFLSLREGHTIGEVRAIAFSALIVGNIFLILTDLSKTRSFLYVFTKRHVAAASILVAATIILFLIIILPPFRLIFSFEFPGYQHFVPAILASSFVLIVLELIKFYRLRYGD